MDETRLTCFYGRSFSQRLGSMVACIARWPTPISLLGEVAQSKNRLASFVGKFDGTIARFCF